MRYFRGGDWQEFDGLPDDAVLLFRSVGTDNVRKMEEILRKHKILYFMGAEQKDDVRFYVQKEGKNEIELMVKRLLQP